MASDQIGVTCSFYRNLEVMSQPSKLMQQLARQQRIVHAPPFHEELIEEIYNTICKIDPKNLMLVEFLSLMIERDFLKNSTQLGDMQLLFDEFRVQPNDPELGISKVAEGEEQKFGKRKFVRMLQELAKRLYSGFDNAYETILYDKLTRVDFEEVRLKVDDSLRKMLNRDTIAALQEYNHEFQGVFEVYMPENYNSHLDFKWEEIRVLEKRLPIICFLRFLCQAEVVPQIISTATFLEAVTKLKPPALPTSTSNKELMFYSNETLNGYLRDHVQSPQIKLLEGDSGLSFFEFQVLIVKLAIESSKQSKSQLPTSIHKFATVLKLSPAFDEGSVRKNKFMETVKAHGRRHSGKPEAIIVRKRESRKKIQDLYDTKDIELEEEASKQVYRNMSVESHDLQFIRKDLDSELGELPPRRKVEKQNNGYFDVEKKHVVIGEQLPKIIEKTKAAAPKDPKKKQEDPLMGYKPETPKPSQESDIGRIIRRPKKLRANSEFPIILNEVFYPSDLGGQLFISPRAEVFLETSYIHLGERMYEQAFAHFTKARANTDSKSSLTQFYYNLHAAQIFESAGRDEVALSFYHKAKELLGVLSSVEGAARAQPYVGMGVCLYHMEEYDYACRCFEKARTVQGLGLQVESVQNAILHNNVGCCLMMLGRNQEAIRCFEIGHHLLDLKVGCFDERTLVVQQNFNKNRKAYLELLPEFKTMWKAYTQKSVTKLPSVKAAKSKKK